MREGLLFVRHLCLEFSGDSYLCFQLFLLHSLLGSLILLSHLRFPLVSEYLSYDLARRAVVISGPVLLIATWICLISYRSEYRKLLVLLLVLLLNSWLNFKIRPVEVFPICITLIDNHLNCLNWFNFLFFIEGPFDILINYLMFFWLPLDVTKIFTSTIYFLLQLDSCNSLPVGCFSWYYDLNAYS